MCILDVMRVIHINGERKGPGLGVSHQVDSDFLSDQDLCRKLGISIVTIRRWRLEGREMPQCIRLGKLVRYHRLEVEQWIGRVVAGELRAGSRKSGRVS